jgi:hypothetical protein
MLPSGLPDKDDVVSAVFEDLLTGAPKREDTYPRLAAPLASQTLPMGVGATRIAKRAGLGWLGMVAAKLGCLVLMPRSFRVGASPALGGVSFVGSG